jgi:hypothetical protein
MLKFIFEDLLIKCKVRIKNKNRANIISNKLNIKKIDFTKKTSSNCFFFKLTAIEAPS